MATTTKTGNVVRVSKISLSHQRYADRISRRRTLVPASRPHCQATTRMPGEVSCAPLANGPLRIQDSGSSPASPSREGFDPCQVFPAAARSRRRTSTTGIPETTKTLRRAAAPLRSCTLEEETPRAEARARRPSSVARLFSGGAATEMTSPPSVSERPGRERGRTRADTRTTPSFSRTSSTKASR